MNRSILNPGCRRLRRMVIGGLAIVIVACSPAAENHDYGGISDAHPTGSRHISPDNLVVAFDMETITVDDRLRDFSPHQHHSILLQKTVVTGLFGNALQFKTIADRIDIPETPNFEIDGPLSIALWFQMDTPDLHQHLIAVDDKFVVWINQANRIRFTDTRGNGLETQESIEPGQWYSLVAVFKGAFGTQLSDENIRLYLNSAPMPVYIVGQPPNEPPSWKPGQLFPTDAVYIGFESHQGESTHQELSFQGVIDEVLIFSRALNFDEILAHADGS